MDAMDAMNNEPFGSDSRLLTGLVLAWSFVMVGASVPAAAQDETRRPESAPRATPGPAIDENDDDDNAARRVRVSAAAKLALPAGTVQVVYPLLPADGPDAAAVAGLGDGEVLELTRSLAIKLKTEVELRFPGGAVARTGNVSPGYPGVYSLWLRRSRDGWRLVLNGEPDIWGTMRDPGADVGETPLTHQLMPEEDAKSTFEATLLASNGGGVLSILWGNDRWTAQFEAGPGMTAASAQKPPSPQPKTGHGAAP
jgi:hypothetical protein